MARRCIFCGRGGPFTREHVLPEWAARLIGGGRLEVTGRRLNEPARTWQSVGSFGTTVRTVCARCNNEWMSTLEQDARPILTSMIRPVGRVELSVDAQVVTASWLWKLAIVHEHASGARYFNTAERRCLRGGDAPPASGVRMWISDYSGRLVADLRGGPSTFSAPNGRVIDGFLMTMHLRHFAAQVLCVREPRDVRVRTVARYDFAALETQIWPERNEAIRWPLPRGLNASGFETWHLRWNQAG